jgi:AmiR/NasT family two-component response regulator
LAAADTRFLVAAGESTVRVALSFMLEARGYAAIRTARSAPRTELVLGEFQPDIVFLDLELAARLPLIESLHSIRLIALTDTSQLPGGTECGIRVPFERFLAKPVAQDALDEILRVPSSDPRRPRH